MEIKIRLEEEKDFKRVEDMAREAFWNLYFPGAHEHIVVNKLRKSKDFIKDLTHVIEVDGEVQGAIFYTHSKVVDEKNIEHKTISFGPVFISPKFHRQGLGRKLITYTIERAREKNYSAILTLGYPYHYKPYGFLGAKKYLISMPDMKFYSGLLALPLKENSLDGINGYVVFSEDLEVTEEEVEAFEKTLPPKVKAFQESQLEYERACAELDENRY